MLHKSCVSVLYSERVYTKGQTAAIWLFNRLLVNAAAVAELYTYLVTEMKQF